MNHTMDASYNNIDKNTSDILFKHMKITRDTNVVIFYDNESKLASALSQSYARHLIHPQLVEFPDYTEDEVTTIINTLHKGDLVILVQSTSFRMSKFRWRLELFDRNLMVVEHARLGFVLESEYQTYIDSLTCDIEPNTFRAQKIAALIDNTQKITFTCKDGSVFTINGPFEEVKPNLGVYDNMQGKGGGFPVGETFTEPKNLDAFNGQLSIRAYPSTDHRTVICEPFLVHVRNGVLTFDEKTAPQEFQEVMKLPQSENPDGAIRMREIGFGLNNHIGFEKPLSEVTAFERQTGLHFSLGMKHNIYRKKVPEGINQRYHIDIFIDIAEMKADDTVFFRNGEYVF